METEKIYTQHEENKTWMNNLLFYSDEIKIMQNRLQEIAAKNTSKDVFAKVEQLQNRIIIQKEAIDIAKHEINLSNDNIHAEVNKNITAVDLRKIEDHVGLRDNMDSFEKEFLALKSDFNTFLIKWM